SEGHASAGGRRHSTPGGEGTRRPDRPGTPLTGNSGCTYSRATSSGELGPANRPANSPARWAVAERSVANSTLVEIIVISYPEPARRLRPEPQAGAATTHQPRDSECNRSRLAPRPRRAIWLRSNARARRCRRGDVLLPWCGSPDCRVWGNGS